MTLQYLENRLENLENLVSYLVNIISKNKVYTDADISGVRKATSDITPFTAIKTAYIDDTYVTFENIPPGNISVFMKDSDGNDVTTIYHVENGNLIVEFYKRESLATVSISIL